MMGEVERKTKIIFIGLSTSIVAIAAHSFEIKSPTRTISIHKGEFNGD